MRVAALAVVALVLIALAGAWFVLAHDVPSGGDAGSTRPWDPYEGSAN